MFDYHDTEIRAERLVLGRDHCDTTGPIYQLELLVAEGRIVDPASGISLTTTEDRRLIYAVDAKMRVSVGFDGERGTPSAVKHETLFHNAPVAAAGELEVADGVIVGINDRSGSYGTTGLFRADRRLVLTVLEAMLLAGVPLADAVVDYLESQAGR